MNNNAEMKNGAATGSEPPKTDAVGNGRIKLNIGRTVMVGLAFFTVTMFWQLYDNLMPLFLADFDELAGNSMLVGLIMAIDNVIAIILLPFMGGLSDKFKSKLGRRIPFIVVGSVLAAVLLLLMNMAHNLKILPLLMVITVFMLIAMCFYRTPAVSLMPDVTPKPVRSKANAVINIMGLVGGVIVLVLTMIPAIYSEPAARLDENGNAVLNNLGMKVLVTSGNNWILVSIIAVFMIAAALVMLFKVKELKLVEAREKMEKEAGIYEAPPEVSQKKLTFKENFTHLSRPEIKSLFFILVSVFLWYMAYNGVTTFFSTFCYKAVEIDNFSLPLLLGNIFGFLCFIPASIVGSKIGRRNTVIIGVALLALGFLYATFIMIFFSQIKAALPDYSVFQYIILPAFAFVGGGWAFINVHSYVMSVEFADKNNTGFFTGLYYAFAMSAQALAPVIMGAILMTSDGFRWMFPFALIMTICAGATMFFVKHGNAKPLMPKSKLEMLDVDD